ncbi:hypothetical protein SAMN02910398_00398 [Butyrivibrio sp. YAB3001]|nr:hypothetical protein SAMN02910398_00398 [Butyrivibrio sp. YAB3001]
MNRVGKNTKRKNGKEISINTAIRFKIYAQKKTSSKAGLLNFPGLV